MIVPALVLLTIAAFAATAGAQLAVSGNDNKVVNVHGVNTVVKNPPADTVSIIDLKASPPRVIGEVQAPVSVVGPPLCAGEEGCARARVVYPVYALQAMRTPINPASVGQPNS